MYDIIPISRLLVPTYNRPQHDNRDATEVYHIPTLTANLAIQPNNPDFFSVLAVTRAGSQRNCRKFDEVNVKLGIGSLEETASYGVPNEMR